MLRMTCVMLSVSETSPGKAIPSDSILPRYSHGSNLFEIPSDDFFTESENVRYRYIVVKYDYICVVPRFEFPLFYFE